MYGVCKSRYKYKIALQYNLLTNSFHSSTTTTNECYYKTLGVVRDASEKDIRSAYIQMAKKYHPDVNTQLNSTQKFTSINEAYSILSDKLKKQKYDSQIGNLLNHKNNTQKNGHTKNWWDFNFYGHNNSNPNTNNKPYEEDYGDFEFGRDFYGDFSRFSTNDNNKNRKRKRDNSNNEYNAYADYYYYYQQQTKNNQDTHNHQHKKYENVWKDFEFEFEVEHEFDSEFNNDAFWKFLRNNNKKNRTKHQENNNENKKKNNNNNKEKIKEKIKSNNNKNSNNNNKQQKEKEKEKEKENNTKTKRFKQKEVSINDIEIDLDLDFLEATLGCTKNINFERNEICNNCGGTSFELDIECIQCIKCEGNGYIYGFGNDFVSHKCINCGGRGYIFKNCTNCNGKASINVHKSLTITIPSGIRDNDRVRVSKQGHQYMNKINNSNNHKRDIIRHGHIWINCKMKKHEHFIRINNDIHVTMNVPYVLAVLGGSFVVPTIYGPNIIKILSGINTNDYECMEGKGIYDASTNKKGNQYIHFVINIPAESELNQQQKQLLNQYAKLEKAPVVIKTTNNLKHFKKYGQKVQTYNRKDKDMEDIDDDIDDDGDEFEDEDVKQDDFSDEYLQETDFDDDDLKDLL